MRYRSNFGVTNYIGVWTNRIFWTAIFVMASLHFEENPSGLTILMLFVLFILVRIKTDQISVNDDSIEIRQKFFLDLLPIVTVIEMRRLRDIQIQGNRTVASNIVLNILPFGMKLWNRLTFVLADGKIKSFRTEIFLDQLETFKSVWTDGKLQGSTPLGI